MQADLLHAFAVWNARLVKKTSQPRGVQVIDDTKGDTLAAASTLTQDIRQQLTEQKSSGGNKARLAHALWFTCTSIAGYQGGWSCTRLSPSLGHVLWLQKASTASHMVRKHNTKNTLL